MKIRISPFALADLEDSIDFYNSQSDNLGIEFAMTIDSTFERIKENSDQFPKEYKEMRKAKVERFSFNPHYS
ncbi:MAG: hypothetical protein JXL97_16295 [Bacteroidales bacterium]|nr:hypothetical protein [Bacteroidales bacterium]